MIVGILAIWLAATPVIAAQPPVAETLAEINRAKDSAEDWMKDRADQYEAFLGTNPTPIAAASERSLALFEIGAKAVETETYISFLMAQHPGSISVQQAGEDALQEVSSDAQQSSSDVTDAYEEFVAGVVVTTTTIPTVTTSSTTSTTVPAAAPPAPTTSTSPSTTTSTTPTTNPVAVTPSTATTSTTTAVVPDDSSSSGAEPRLIRSSLLVAAAGSGDEAASSTPTPPGGGMDLAPVLGMLRLRLPSAVSEPLIDLLIVLQAIAAAFMSGMRAMAWPVGILTVGFAMQYGVRSIRRT